MIIYRWGRKYPLVKLKKISEPDSKQNNLLPSGENGSLGFHVK
jgi:hypothetical protein